MPPSSHPPETGPPSHPSPADAGKVVRQHAHDVRNQLNSLELGVTLIQELASGDEEVVSTLSQMRQALALIEASLKLVVRRFSEPRPVSIPAWELAGMWRSGLALLLPSNQTVDWIPPEPTLTFWLDPAGVGTLMTDLILTISRRSKGRPLRILFRRKPDGFSAVELREPPQDLQLGQAFLEDFAGQIIRHGGQSTHSKEEVTGEWVYLLTFPPRAADPPSSATPDAPSPHSPPG